MASNSSTGSRTVRAKNSPRRSTSKTAGTAADDSTSSHSTRLRWISAHLAVLALAIFSWAWCSQLFNTPESPGHYGFLREAGLLPELTAFSAFSIPAGESCPPLRFHQRHSQLGASQLDALNRQFLRDYIRNYSKAQNRLYLTGEYQIRNCRQLTDQDPIQDGLLVKLRAQVKPEGGTIPSDYPIELHWIIPGNNLSTTDFPDGTTIEFQKIPDSVTPLHVSNREGEQFTLVSATVISLAYGEKTTTTDQKITTSPPEKLRLRNPWPDANS